MRRLQKNTSDGFTIVEIVVALVLLGILLVSLIGLFGSIQQSQRYERYRDLANSNARNIIENSRNNQYDSYDFDQTYDVSSQLSSGLPGGTASLSVSHDADNTDLKMIKVSVTYNVNDAMRSVIMTALVGKNGLVN